MAQTPIAMNPIFSPSFWREIWSGVWESEVSGRQPMDFFSFPRSIPAISSTRVFIPMAVTTPRAEQSVTWQLEKTMVSGVSFASPP